ncbi:MAG: Rod shape-determining protein MreD [Cytophagaceae bacterium]
MKIRNIILPASYAFIFFSLQILIFRNFALFNYAFCFVYVGFIILLPYEIPVIASLLMAFIFGAIIDVFYDTIGMHAAASVLITYMRPYIVNLLTPRGGYDATIEISARSLGWQWFFSYSAIMILIHHTALFAIEAWGLDLFFRMIGKIFFSTVFTLSVFLSIQYLVTDKR